MVELVFLTKFSVSCFSCARSSNERQLAIGDKPKTKTIFRKIIKVDNVVLLRAIIFSLYYRLRVR